MTGLPPGKPASPAPPRCCAGSTPSSPAASPGTPTAPPVSVPVRQGRQQRPDHPPWRRTLSGPAPRDNRTDHPLPRRGEPAWPLSSQARQTPRAAPPHPAQARLRVVGNPPTGLGTSPLDHLRRDAGLAAEPPTTPGGSAARRPREHPEAGSSRMPTPRPIRAATHQTSKN